VPDIQVETFPVPQTPPFIPSSFSVNSDNVSRFSTSFFGVFFFMASPWQSVGALALQVAPIGAERLIPKARLFYGAK
jgi:hypothetical protein